MNKALLPHTGNKYIDEAGWTVIVTGVDYGQRMAGIHTITVGNTDPGYGGDTGAFYTLFKDEPDKPKQVKFADLRQVGIRSADV